MKIEIIQFQDGTFGVRRYFLNRFEFADFRTLGLWWANDSKFIADCHGTHEQALSAYRQMTDTGTPVGEPQNSPMTEEQLRDLAHTLYSASQLMPNEGIDDAIDRMMYFLGEHFKVTP